MLDTFLLRKHELSRRVENLPQEVKNWRAATEAEVDLNAHFSQLQAIEVLTNALVDQLRTKVGSLDTNASAETFNVACLDVVKNIIRAQKSWNFFRDKLDLRHSPSHKESLWVADTIAWDCHRPVMNNAVQFGIIQPTQLREPPLVYCTAEYSPATWVRGSRPNDGRAYDLGETVLPIPVVEMPWDHLGSAWEYLALHHEVGHDIEADLKLRNVLQQSLQTTLAAAGVPPNRIAVWIKWEGEVFADLCALQLAGPAFTDALMRLIMLPADSVKIFDEDDPHPTNYPRILMNAAYIRTLGNTPALSDHATQIEVVWKAIYGDNTGDPTLDGLPQDFPLVFTALMDTKFPVLKNHSVRELIPFSVADDARIRAAERFFRTGMNRPNGLPVRHTVSAARMAINKAAQENAITDQLCNDIHKRVGEYVRETAPGGLRGGGPDEHEKFIASFAERMFRE